MKMGLREEQNHDMHLMKCLARVLAAVCGDQSVRLRCYAPTQINTDLNKSTKIQRERPNHQSGGCNLRLHTEPCLLTNQTSFCNGVNVVLIL